MSVNDSYIFTNGSNTNPNYFNGSYYGSWANTINDVNINAGAAINANKIYWDDAEIAKIREMINHHQRKRWKLFWEKAALEFDLED